jgi:hypothetical protein
VSHFEKEDDNFFILDVADQAVIADAVTPQVTLFAA